MPKTRVGRLALKAGGNQTLEAASSGRLAAEHRSRGTCGDRISGVERGGHGASQTIGHGRISSLEATRWLN